MYVPVEAGPGVRLQRLPVLDRPRPVILLRSHRPALQVIEGDLVRRHHAGARAALDRHVAHRHPAFHVHRPNGGAEVFDHRAGAAADADRQTRQIRALDPRLEHGVLGVHLQLSVGPEDAHAHYLYAVSIGERLELSGTREKVRLGQQCREQAELALTLDPDHPGALHVLGRLHAGTMRLSRITRFVAKHLLGAKALEGASWEKAEHYFTRAAELEPSNPRHWTELAQLYVDTGRPTRAKDALQRALAGAVTCESERLMLDRAGRMLENLEGPR